MDEQYETDYERRHKRLNKKAKKKSSGLLTVIQIITCSIVLAAAIFIRMFGGNAYIVIRNWYLKNINNSIVADEDIKNVKHSVVELFPSASGLMSQADIKPPDTDSKASTSSASAASSQQPAESQANPSSQKANS